MLDDVTIGGHHWSTFQIFTSLHLGGENWGWGHVDLLHWGGRGPACVIENGKYLIRIKKKQKNSNNFALVFSCM